jgi:non-homologous end joining protein Ku
MSDKTAVTGGKSIGTLNLQLGPVPCALKVYKPVEDASSSGFNNGCPKDDCHAPLKMPKECEVHGKLAEYEAPVKITMEGDTVLIFTDAEITEELELATKKNFIMDSTPLLKDVEHLLYYAEGSYYTAPAAAGSALLYESLVKSLTKDKRVIVGKYSLRSNRETLAIIRPFGGTLMIQHIPFHANRRAIPEIKSVGATPKDVAMLSEVLSTLNKEFVYSDITDEYEEALGAMKRERVRIMMGKSKKKVKAAAVKVKDGLKEARSALESLFNEVSKKSSNEPKVA